MEFILQPSELFLEQVAELSDGTKRVLEKRFLLVKQNPFRNKRIVGQDLFLFRIRFEDRHIEKRVIYLVNKPYVKILCILDRSNDYRDLRKYLERLGY